MRHVVAGLLGLIAAGAVSAAGTMGCVGYHPVWQDTPAVTAAYVGMPGAFFVGVVSPDEKLGAFMNEAGEWVPYEGGLYPIAKRYVGGLPASVTLRYALPEMTTGSWAGWKMAVGYAALTPAALDTIRTRREFLDKVKPERVAQGRWHSIHDNDDQIKWATLVKFLQDKKTYRESMIIPILDCSPPSH